MSRNNIIIVVGVVILLIGGIFLFLNKPTDKPKLEETETQSDIILDLAPEEIDLKLSATPDGKKVQFSIGKMKDIKAIAYELIYEADATQQEKGDGSEERIQRGITGEAKFTPGDPTYRSPELDLGSCSKKVCRYDTGVSSINLLLKITKNDNKVYQVEQSLEL